MIFFNIKQAREQLVNAMKVYTLRSEWRKTGKTLAVVGNMYQNMPIYEVNVKKIMNISLPEDLLPYLDYSGFDSVYEWFEAAAPSARTLYEVTKAE